MMYLYFHFILCRTIPFHISPCLREVIRQIICHMSQMFITYSKGTTLDKEYFLVPPNKESGEVFDRSHVSRKSNLSVTSVPRAEAENKRKKYSTRRSGVSNPNIPGSEEVVKQTLSFRVQQANHSVQLSNTLRIGQGNHSSDPTRSNIGNANVGVLLSKSVNRSESTKSNIAVNLSKSNSNILKSSHSQDKTGSNGQRSNSVHSNQSGQVLQSQVGQPQKPNRSFAKSQEQFQQLAASQERLNKLAEYQEQLQKLAESQEQICGITGGYKKLSEKLDNIARVQENHQFKKQFQLHRPQPIKFSYKAGILGKTDEDQQEMLIRQPSLKGDHSRQGNRLNLAESRVLGQENEQHFLRQGNVRELSINGEYKHSVLYWSHTHIPWGSKSTYYIFDEICCGK